MIGLQLPAFPKDNILNRKELWAQPRIGWPGRGGRGYSCLDILEGMPSEAELFLAMSGACWNPPLGILLLCLIGSSSGVV